MRQSTKLAYQYFRLTEDKISVFIVERAQFRINISYIYGLVLAYDIDECAVQQGNFSTKAACTNTLGSFECTRLPGFSGNGFNCTGKLDSNPVVLTKYPSVRYSRSN